MPDKMRIEVAPNQEVTALVYPAGKPDLAGVTVILGTELAPIKAEIS